MKKDNIVQDKSYAFALRIVKLYQYLVKEKKEYMMAVLNPVLQGWDKELTQEKKGRLRPL